MTTASNKINTLHGTAQFALFVTSYLPLFFLIVIRQLAQNSAYLHFAGFNVEGITIFFSKFCLSTVLILLSLFGWFGYKQTFKNIEKDAANGFHATVKDVRNKNSESIGYIATYIIPFLFQSFDSWYECVSVLFLLVIIYRIYINSSLLLINPILSFKFAIYEIEFIEGEKIKNGLVISRNKYLQEEEEIKLYPIGHKLYFIKTDN